MSVADKYKKQRDEQTALVAELRAQLAAALERVGVLERALDGLLREHDITAADTECANSIAARAALAVEIGNGPSGPKALSVDAAADERMERLRAAQPKEQVSRLSAQPTSGPKAPATSAQSPDLSVRCLDNSPGWWKGRWLDWHRGHGCGKDDGQPVSPEGVKEFAAAGRLPGRAQSPDELRAENARLADELRETQADVDYLFRCLPRGAPVATGSSRCPICGASRVHQHTYEEVYKHKTRFARKHATAALEKEAADNRAIRQPTPPAPDADG